MFDAVDARSNSGNHVPVGKTSAAVGSLTVTASQNLAGVALEHNTQEDHATVLQATRGFTTGDSDTTLYAPINKNNYYGRFTGLQVQNVSGNLVDMNVTYKGAGGSCPSGTFADSASGVANGASHTFPSKELPDGSATANLSAPLFKEDSYGNGTGLSIENVGAVDATNVVITLTGPTGNKSLCSPSSL
jgi:hypothetical protein